MPRILRVSSMMAASDFDRLPGEWRVPEGTP
jgi:hypothetical protein